MRKIVLPVILVLSISCGGNSRHTKGDLGESVFRIERLDEGLDRVVDSLSSAEIIATGFEWAEGPLWVEGENMLLFSDVPRNTIYKWTEQDGVEVYLRPSGYTANSTTKSPEPGSNGLLLDSNGHLVLCQHGDRRLARMESSLGSPEANFTTLADRYLGDRFSSPNDAVYNNKGELFFTDPPYGLHSQDDTDPAKEISFNGVYCLRSDGELALLTDGITRPNGIALFPGEKRLLIGNSDPKAAVWYLLDLEAEGSSPTVFYDATDQQAGVSGLPDGLKINRQGIVFASGPGGVWIFDQEGKLLGKFLLEKAVSNIALSADEKMLFMTNTDVVLRVPLL